MSIVGTLVNAFVVLAVGAFLTYITLDRYRQLRVELKADVARLDERVDKLEGRMEAGFGAIRAEMDSGFNAIRAEVTAQFNSLRSDLTAIALAVGAGKLRT